MPAGRSLPMFPLSTVLFPGAGLALHVFEPRYRALVADCLAGDGAFGVVLIARGSEVGGGDERVSVGTEADIEEAQPFPDGRWRVLARGRRPIAVHTWTGEDPYPRAVVGDVTDSGTASTALVDLAARSVRRAHALASELNAAASGSAPEPLAAAAEEAAWQLCARAPLGPLDHQRLLESHGAGERLTLLVELVDAVSEDLARLLSHG
jgi:hypothetical protein